METLQTDQAPKMLKDMMAENPEAFRFDDIRIELVADPEAEVSPQRMLGGYLPVEGKPGFFTREMMLRQEIELAERAEEMQAAAGKGPAAMRKVMLPICRLILFKRDGAGDFVQAEEEDLLDHFKGKELLALVQEVTGFGQAATDESPTTALLTTETSSAA